MRPIELVLDLPIAFGPKRAVRLDVTTMRRLELLNAGIHRLGPKAELEAEVVVQAIAIYIHPGEERQERIANCHMIERLYSKSVSCHEKPSARSIPKCKGKHSTQFLDAALPPPFVGPKNHLRIGSCLKLRAPQFLS